MATLKGWFNPYGDGSRVCYEITDEQKDEIVMRLLQYYKDYSCFGEAIHQDDDSIMEAPSVLSDICDNIIKFEYKE